MPLTAKAGPPGVAGRNLTRYYTCEQQQFSVLLKAALSMQHPSKCTEQLFVLVLSRNVPRGGSKSDPCKIGEKIVLFHEQVWIFLVNNHLQIIKFFNYSLVLYRSHMDTIWNFDPNYSLPNVTRVSPPKKFRIVATWLQFSKSKGHLRILICYVVSNETLF